MEGRRERAREEGSKQTVCCITTITVITIMTHRYGAEITEMRGEKYLVTWDNNSPRDRIKALSELRRFPYKQVAFAMDVGVFCCRSRSLLL